MRDYRVQQIRRMANFQVYLGSRLSPEDILEFGVPNVILETGGTWRRDGVGRWRDTPGPWSHCSPGLWSGTFFAGSPIEGPIVIYDDDR